MYTIQQGVGQVRAEETWRCVAVVDVIEELQGVDELDEVVGGGREERVASGAAVERRVRGPAQGGEGEGLELGGAGLGEACKEDVGGAALEGGVDSLEE